MHSRQYHAQIISTNYLISSHWYNTVKNSSKNTLFMSVKDSNPPTDGCIWLINHVKKLTSPRIASTGTSINANDFLKKINLCKEHQQPLIHAQCIGTSSKSQHMQQQRKCYPPGTRIGGSLRRASGTVWGTLNTEKQRGVSVLDSGKQW